MKTEMTIDEVLEIVQTKYGFLKWKKSKRWDGNTYEITCEVKKATMTIYCGKFKDDVSDGEYFVCYGYQEKDSGHSGPCTEIDRVFTYLENDLKEFGLIPDETQMSIFDFMGGVNNDL